MHRVSRSILMGFICLRGISFKKGKPCIPQGSIRKLLDKESHEGGFVGHFRIDKTLSFLKKQILLAPYESRCSKTL